MKLKPLIICAAWLALSGAAVADDARELALATEVLELQRSGETVRNMFNDLAPLMAQGMGAQLQLSPSQTGRLTEILREELLAATPDLMGAAARAYVDEMTEEQLVEIRAFLLSPAGRAMMAAQPRLQQTLRTQGQVVGMQVSTRALQRLVAEAP